jgi:large subunit ribosomal protein L10
MEAGLSELRNGAREEAKSVPLKKGEAMALNLEQKKVVVAELANVAAKAHSLVAAEYAGLTVGQLTELRKKARQTKVYVKVAKNTLVRRAVEGTDYAVVKDALVGPMLYAFSEEDPGAAGRLVKEFSKANEKLVPKVVAIGGQMFPGSHVEKLASLPTREQALSMLLGVIQAPITKLVRTLAEPAAQVARVVAAVRDQKAAG